LDLRVHVFNDDGKREFRVVVVVVVVVVVDGGHL
jgi:hypothetical protein